MKHRYLPMTEQDQQEMLKTVGANSIEDLFKDIPEEIRFKGELPVSKRLDEYALTTHLSALAAKNANTDQYPSFLGAGLYDHHIPSVINHVVSRSEFYTAYTPYQPEISQGELQAIFEFQSYICELTGMAVANASMYDGATASRKPAPWRAPPPSAPNLSSPRRFTRNRGKCFIRMPGDWVWTSSRSARTTA